MLEKKYINGATLLYQKRNLPVTSIVIATKVGSVYERRNIKGISHFVEHLIFKSTAKRTQKEIVQEIESVGGLLNAFTSYEVTGFYAKIPSLHFYRALDVLSDMTQNPIFPSGEIAKEKKVIIEEIKMVHDDPKRFIFDKTMECLYAGDFGFPILGFKETIKSLTRKKIIEWHRKNYLSENFVIGIVGKNDFYEVEDALKEKIVKKYKQIGKISPTKCTEICKNFTEKRSHIDQAHLTFSFHLPNGFSKYIYACELIDAVLGYGMSSWLFQEIREKRALAYSVKSNLEIGANYGHLLIYVGTDKSKVKEVESVILNLIKKLKEIHPEELALAKEELIGNKEIKREDSLSASLEMIEYELFNRIDEFTKYDEKIGEVKPEDIKKIVEGIKGIAKVKILPK